jgi:hypothetical protein
MRKGPPLARRPLRRDKLRRRRLLLPLPVEHVELLVLGDEQLGSGSGRNGDRRGSHHRGGDQPGEDTAAFVGVLYDGLRPWLSCLVLWSGPVGRFHLLAGLLAFASHRLHDGFT